MKRFAIFALLGPPLGFLILCFMSAPLWTGGVWTNGLALIFTLVLFGPTIYSVGLAPALTCGIIDVFLERLPIYQRLTMIGAAGYLLSYLPIRGSKFPLTIDAFAYGLTGLIAAVVCSWLTSGRQIQRASGDTSRPPSGVD